MEGHFSPFGDLRLGGKVSRLFSFPLDGKKFSCVCHLCMRRTSSHISRSKINLPFPQDGGPISRKFCDGARMETERRERGKMTKLAPLSLVYIGAHSLRIHYSSSFSSWCEEARDFLLGAQGGEGENGKLFCVFFSFFLRIMYASFSFSWSRCSGWARECEMAFPCLLLLPDPFSFPPPSSV